MGGGNVRNNMQAIAGLECVAWGPAPMTEGLRGTSEIDLMPVAGQSQFIRGTVTWSK